MATIECTQREFSKAYTDFLKVQGSTNSTQDEVALAYKCLVLHYIGVQDIDEDQVEFNASMIEVATKGAMRRGWTLIEPTL